MPRGRTGSGNCQEMPGPRGRSRFEAGGLWDRCGTPWRSQAGLHQKGTLMWVSRRCRAAGPVGGPEASRDHARPPAPPRARPPRVSSPRRRQQVFSPALGAHTGLRLREEPGVPHRVWGGQQGRLHRLGSLLGLSCTVPDGGVCPSGLSRAPGPAGRAVSCPVDASV